MDILISGIGTGGTLTGVCEYIKPKKPSFKAIAVEPVESPVLSGGQPGPHKIQGIGAGFVPSILRTDYIDEVIQVSSEEAIGDGAPTGQGRRPAGGHLVGSGGGGRAASGRSATENAGKLIVVVLPVFGERYLSSLLFEQLRNEALAMVAEGV